MKKFIFLLLISFYFCQPALAITEKFYSTANNQDGNVRYSGITSWATNHDATTGTNISDNITDNSWCYLVASPSNYSTKRYFGYYKTDTIPDDAIINSVSFNFLVYQLQNATSTISFNIYKSNDVYPIDTAMYNKAGTSTPYSTRKAITDFTAGQWGKFDFNIAGINSINKTGYSGLALLQYENDILNIAPTDTVNRNFVFYSYNQTGTSSDPYLEITYNEETYPTITTSTIMLLENVIYNSTTTIASASTTLTEGQYNVPFFLYFLIFSGFSFTILFIWFCYYMIYQKNK